MSLLKSLIAVVGAYVLCVALVMLSDPLLHLFFPNDYVSGRPVGTTLLVLSTVLFAVISAFCAWVCARMAPSRASMHVLWYFAIGEVMGLGSTVAFWGKVPHWYSIAWLVVWIPACWVGYKLSRK